MQEGLKVVLVFVEVDKLLSDGPEEAPCVGCVSAETIMYHHEVLVAAIKFTLDNSLQVRCIHAVNEVGCDGLCLSPCVYLPFLLGLCVETDAGFVEAQLDDVIFAHHVVLLHWKAVRGGPCDDVVTAAYAVGDFLEPCHALNGLDNGCADSIPDEACHVCGGLCLRDEWVVLGMVEGEWADDVAEKVLPEAIFPASVCKGHDAALAYLAGDAVGAIFRTVEVHPVLCECLCAVGPQLVAVVVGADGAVFVVSPVVLCAGLCVLEQHLVDLVCYDAVDILYMVTRQ